MTGHEIRTKFLEFFRSQGHTIVASDSLVPKDDPTVLFTTAGMQQFKPQFMGHLAGFTRAASSQKCLRTDDLTEVGVTDFHHTFFEMLGNFSFGDYFKREAIGWAWEFLTKILDIPEDKLWVSVNKDDQEAYDIWHKEIKVPAERIVKLGDKSNFWPSNARLNGPNGPCGPCSEIFFDWGKNSNCNNPQCDPECSCGRFCEVWNLVFTQYNRKDGGLLESLPAKNIDTGMGLERLAAVMQGKHNNFESDLFQEIFSAIDKHIYHGKHPVTRDGKKERRIVADHIRAIVFMISDGVVPSNEGRGYVVKKLINIISDISIRSGNMSRPSIYKLSAAVVSSMKVPYPELVANVDRIANVVQVAERAYIKLRQEKIPEFEEAMLKIHQDKSLSSSERIQAVGRALFVFFDTYGLKMETMEPVLNITFNDDKLTKEAKSFFEKLMEEQQERSRAGSKMQGDVFLSGDVDVKGLPKTVFLGYNQPSADVTVKAIFVGGKTVAEAKDGDNAAIILDQTPFYAEQGGQTADIGLLKGKTGTVEIKDTQKQNDVVIHQGVVKGGLKTGEVVTASIDDERRTAIMRNHTATHLLQAALRQVLGDHVKQQGSLVDENRLRFDFTHPKGVTKEELEKIEDIVNGFIRRCDVILKKEMSIDEAKQSGALAFFAEKYGETVRVVSVSDYSKEFCGGTHLDYTGQIGLFKIVSEGAVAQGIRRIEAVTGTGALEYVKGRERQLDKAAAVLKAPLDEVAVRVEQQARRVKDLQKEVGDLSFEVVKGRLNDVIVQSEKLGATVFVAQLFKDIEMDTLRRISDLVRQKCPSVVVLLFAVATEDGAVILSVSDDLVKKNVKANELIQRITPLFNGSGGGRPNMAQAGCKDPDKLSAVFESAKKTIKESLNI